MPKGQVPKNKKYIRGEVHEPDYTKSHAERLLPLMEQGLFNTEIAAQFNISTSTFNRWRNDFEEFAIAYGIGRPKRFSWWLTVGRKRLEEKGDHGYKYWVTIMNNMFSEEGWTSEYAKNHGTQINIGNMNVVQKSETELVESIKANLVRLDDATKSVLIESRPELKEIEHASPLEERSEITRLEEIGSGSQGISGKTEI